jgi:phosphopantothenate synthetase
MLAYYAAQSGLVGIMEQHKIMDYIRWRAEILIAGRYDDLARHYKTPAHITSNGRQTHMANHDAVVRALRALRVRVLERGIYRLDPQILACEQHGDATDVRVRWHSVDRHGHTLNHATSQYHFVQVDGALRAIRLINHPVPPQDSHYPRLGHKAA